MHVKDSIEGIRQFYITKPHFPKKNKNIINNNDNFKNIEFY